MQNFKIINVDVNNELDLEKLKQFYNNIYVKAFQIEDEVESYDNLLFYLKKNQNQYIYQILLVEDINKIVGGIIYDYFYESKSLVIEFIAIDNEYRNKKIGKNLYEIVLKKISNMTKNVDYVFCEIEKYNKFSNNYLFFWKSLGFKKLKFNYYQPPLAVNKKEVSNLDLIFYSFNNENKIKVSNLLNFLYNYAEYAMNIKIPKKNKAVKKMIEQLKNLDYVNSEEIEVK